MTAREAREADVAAMVALADAERQVRARQEPLFWRPAGRAVEAHRSWLTRLVADPEAGTFVHDADGVGEGLDGFVVVTLVAAPPVYDLGGLSSVVDDFVASSPDGWPSVGAALLDRASAWARERGAVQVVVVSGHHDGPKRALLRERGLHVATEWHTAPL